MNREKEIHMFARAMCKVLPHDTFVCDTCEHDCKTRKCLFAVRAEELFDEGYRKEKDTAEDILQDFYDRTFELKDPYGDSDEAKKVIDRGDILDMAKYYGAIIDE